MFIASQLTIDRVHQLVSSRSTIFSFYSLTIKHGWRQQSLDQPRSEDRSQSDLQWTPTLSSGRYLVGRLFLWLRFWKHRRHLDLEVVYKCLWVQRQLRRLVLHLRLEGTHLKSVTQVIDSHSELADGRQSWTDTRRSKRLIAAPAGNMESENRPTTAYKVEERLDKSEKKKNPRNTSEQVPFGRPHSWTRDHWITTTAGNDCLYMSQIITIKQ